jgi:hypothetical protein
MLLTGVGIKGLFGMQGVMRLHEGEGSHLVLLMDEWGLFGRNGEKRFSFKITPDRPFHEGDTIFTPLEILPHGEKYWEAWISNERLTVNGLPAVEISSWEGKTEPPKVDLPEFELSVLKTDEPLLTLLPWKEEKPWLLFLQDSASKISIYHLHHDGFQQKIFDPKSPGEIILYDGGKAGYGVEMPPFSSPLFLRTSPAHPPKKPEDARPILRLKAEKNGEMIEKLIPYDSDGSGLSLPIFDTLVKFQPLAIRIPHHLHLYKAKTLYRPGTTTPESYEAKIKVDGQPFTLRMNEVYESPSGYRFYLSNIHGAPNEVKEVHLAVNYDPAKYILTYPGGALIVLGALLLLFRKQRVVLEDLH